MASDKKCRCAGIQHLRTFVFESVSSGILYETVTTAGGVGMTRSVMMKSMKTAAKAEAVAEDCMLSDEEIAPDSGAPESGEQKTNDADGQYRPSEIALAMFRPMLTTDENGLLALTFTVPDANTTWRFIATRFRHIPAAYYRNPRHHSLETNNGNPQSPALPAQRRRG